MKDILRFMNGKKWIEYFSIILVFVGLWLGSFAAEVTFGMRIAQLVMMTVGMLICGTYEYVNRKLDVTRQGLEKKRYVDAKTYELSFFGMLAAYGVVIIYAAAFEQNQLLMFMVIILFVHILLNGMLIKKFQAAFDLHGDDIIEQAKQPDGKKK